MSNNVPANASSFKSFPIYEEIRRGIDDPSKAGDMAKKINGVLCFKLKKSDGKDAAWIIDCKSAKPSIKWTDDVSSVKADCILSMDDQDMMDLALGKLLPQKAFFSGKLKISGNMAMAMKVQSLLQLADRSKL